MNLYIKYAGTVLLLAFLGIACGNITNDNTAYGAETWIKYNETSVGMSGLTATIHVHIKNNKDHVQYFKISQIYTGTLANDTIYWTVDWTDPHARNMIDAVSPELGGDVGWKINPGETKEITFNVDAVGPMGEIPTVIANAAAEENTYWPLIPDPGLYFSCFLPNEIELLNPDLDLQVWRGSFSFLLTNFNSCRVSGIIRAPIVPIDSKLIASSPKATFLDKDNVINGEIAAWDVAMGGKSSRWFSYTYEWIPSSSSSSSSTGTFSSTIPETSAASKTASLPTEETGVPYGLFIVGGILAAGGLIYTRFIR